MIPQKIGSILFDTVLDDQNQLPGEFNQGFPAVINIKKHLFKKQTEKPSIHIKMQKYNWSLEHAVRSDTANQHHSWRTF